jgi:hypothetical protein
MSTVRHQEQRGFLRLRMESRVFIEVMAAEADGSEPSRVVQCHTLDVSQNGLGVGIDERLRVGSILQIGVELPGSTAPFYLTAEVRWCRETEGGDSAYLAGLLILNANGSDVDTWRGLLSHI